MIYPVISCSLKPATSAGTVYFEPNPDEKDDGHHLGTYLQTRNLFSWPVAMTPAAANGEVKLARTRNRSTPRMEIETFHLEDFMLSY